MKGKTILSKPQKNLTPNQGKDGKTLPGVYAQKNYLLKSKNGFSGLNRINIVGIVLLTRGK